MRIWFIKSGEPAYADDSNVRLMRAGILSELATSEGHDVIWWTSTFNHFHKKFRFNENHLETIKSNYKVQYLHSRGYKKNISVDRLYDHLDLAKEFTKESLKFEKPDIIVSCMPTLSICVHAIKYGKKNNIPVIIDIRDLWPDIFIDELIPNALKKLARISLFPFYNKIKYILENASGIVGITDPILKWGVNYADRSLDTDRDKVFPLAYLNQEISSQDYDRGLEVFRNLGVFDSVPELRVCLFGTLSGYKMDLDTVIEAAITLNNSGINVQFIFCGKGEMEEEYKLKSKGLKNVFFPGWVNSNQIKALMMESDLGLAPYRTSVAFKDNIPNKPIEYFSEGLPVLTGIDGYLSTFLRMEKCGYVYENGSPDSLVQIIKKITIHKDDLNQMRKNAKDVFNRRFSSSKVYRSYLEFLESIVNKYHKYHEGVN